MSNAPNKFFGGRDLKQCPICSRYFITHRIKAHEAICQKSTSTTRKYFDVSQQRIGGTDFEKIAKKMGNGTEYTEISKKGPSPLSTNWRSKHDSFIKEIQSLKNKELSDKECEPATDLPSSPILKCEDYVKCPNCLRLFNPPAADRHINMCKKFMSPELQCREIECTAQNSSKISDAENGGS